MTCSRFTRLAVTTAVSLAMLVACGDESEPTGTGSSDTTTPAGQIANPASVFCVEQGGTVEIVDDAIGQVGYCNLPDGTRVEEWEYYRSQSAGTIDADAAPVPVTISISGLESAMGHFLAGVLFVGEGTTNPDERVVGGIATVVTSDPFTADLELKVGDDQFPAAQDDCGAGDKSVPSDCILFPYLTDEQQVVDPGTYTLQLWLSPTTIGPSSRWVPDQQAGLVGCVTTFDVGATGGGVTVTGIPDGGRCIVE